MGELPAARPSPLGRGGTARGSPGDRSEARPNRPSPPPSLPPATLHPRPSRLPPPDSDVARAQPALGRTRLGLNARRRISGSSSVDTRPPGPLEPPGATTTTMMTTTRPVTVRGPTKFHSCARPTRDSPSDPRHHHRPYPRRVSSPVARLPECRGRGMPVIQSRTPEKPPQRHPGRVPASSHEPDRGPGLNGCDGPTVRRPFRLPYRGRGSPRRVGGRVSASGEKDLRARVLVEGRRPVAHWARTRRWGILSRPEAGDPSGVRVLRGSQGRNESPTS